MCNRFLCFLLLNTKPQRTPWTRWGSVSYWTYISVQYFLICMHTFTSIKSLSDMLFADLTLGRYHTFQRDCKVSDPYFKQVSFRWSGSSLLILLQNFANQSMMIISFSQAWQVVFLLVQGNNLRGKEYNLTLHWHVMPKTGKMFADKLVMSGYRLPQEYRWGVHWFVALHFT